MTASLIRWEDPPAPKTGRPAGSLGKWASVAKELQEHPGEWALILDLDRRTSIASYLKRKLGFDIATRVVSNEDGTTRFLVYARWPEKKEG